MRNTFLLLSITLFTLTTNIHAQPDSLWSRTYGGENYEVCYSLIQTSDGGYALAGETESFGAGEEDYWLVKTDENGDSLWSKTFGGREMDYCVSVIQTEDGGYLLAGYSVSFNSGAWIVKTDANGDSLWSRTFTGRCRAIIQTADGGYALAGSTSLYGAGGYDFWILKIDEHGDSLWARTFGGESGDKCNSIVQTEDGGFILAGGTTSFDVSARDIWIVKTDADGDSLWSRTFGGRFNINCHSVFQTDDGGYILTGFMDSNSETDMDIVLIKTDKNGDSLWSNTFGGDGPQMSYTVTQTIDGGYVVVGAGDHNGAGNSEFWFFKTDNEGDILWTRTFGGENYELCLGMIQIDDGSFALAGYTYSLGAGERDMWLVKTGPDPVSVPSESFNPHPCDFVLQPAFPNPFNSSTNIRFDLPVNSDVSITIFNLNGRSVVTLLNDQLTAGSHNLSWDAKDNPAGLYLCRMEAGGINMTRKLLLIK